MGEGAGSGGRHATIRVLIVDDQKLMREGLRTLLELEEGIAVAGEAADGAAAVDAYLRLHPDVVLMDLRMPGMDGVEAIRRIRGTDSEAKILVLTTFDEDALVFESVRAGARGYVLKDLGGTQLAQAIRTIAAGGAALQPTVARKVMDAFARLAESTPGSEPHLQEPLSARERAVLGLVARGHSNKEIAERLFLAEGTVKNHVSTILAKIGARDRTQAALQARQLGLIDE
ncbi:MAG TPA: response regulator transcription factor [Spirochaetia bacterium]|nr:response regulator transcription factor [Spirochaetia bacterium]